LKILLTGHAGFIGFHLARYFLDRGDEVVGVDNLNPYYDPALKRARLSLLEQYDRFTHVTLSVEDGAGLADIFATHKPAVVVHLAAQAGVRYSVDHPEAYLTSNLVGFGNILECCRNGNVEHLMFASSSSVYGGNSRMPFSVHDTTDHPVSLYAATKKANEVMAHSYSHLYGIPTTGLRFFTVYGPWGRPDMALFLFADAILKGEAINIYNHGNMKRSFTYIDDVVEAVARLSGKIPAVDSEWDSASPDPASSGLGPYRIYNIGSEEPELLMDCVRLLEQALGREAVKNMMPIQQGDVPATWADVEGLKKATGYSPTTSLEEGIGRFVDWYRSFYKI